MFSVCSLNQSQLPDYNSALHGAHAHADPYYHSRRDCEVPRGRHVYDCGAEEIVESDSELETPAMREARAREAAAALLNVRFIGSKSSYQQERSSQKKGIREPQKSRYNSCSARKILDMCDQHEMDLDMDVKMVRQDDSDEQKDGYSCM